MVAVAAVVAVFVAITEEVIFGGCSTWWHNAERKMFTKTENDPSRSHTRNMGMVKFSGPHGTPLYSLFRYSRFSPRMKVYFLFQECGAQRDSNTSSCALNT